MENFIKKDIEWNKIEFLIDKNLFSKDIVLKAAYNFLDKWYFFFKLDEYSNIIFQFTSKEGELAESDKIIWDFSDELLSVWLRDKLEHDNKEIREKIVWAAIWDSLDSRGFIEIDTDRKNDNWEQNQIDFDKDIDEILREIENDPELKIDEEEIERILREIESETSLIETEDSKITLDPNNLKDVKSKLQNRG